MHKRLRLLLPYPVLSAIFMASQTQAADRKTPALHLSGEFPMRGHFAITIFDSSKNQWAGPVVFQTNIVVVQAETSIALPSLPKGDYYVRVLHDANGDGKMNSNAFGVPTEASAHQPLIFEPKNVDITLRRAPADLRTWGAGIMTIYSSSPYCGGKSEWRVLPLLTYVGERFYLVGPRTGYNLLKSRWGGIGLVANYKFTDDAFDDSAFLDGMEKRRDTAMGGVDINLRGFGAWRIDTSLMTDILGFHDGQEFNLALSQNFRGKNWAFSPGVGTTWHSGSFNDNNFGVHDTEVLEGRPAYDPGASVEWFARFFSRCDLTKRWSVLVNLRFELLSQDVQDSPIVDKDILTTGFIGLNYAF